MYNTPSSRMNRSASYSHLFENNDKSATSRREEMSDSSASMANGLSNINKSQMTSLHGSRGSLTTPVVMTRKGTTLADALEDRRRRESISVQLKGLHLPSRTSLCGDALAGSKIGAGTDLPTITGRRALPKALMPKDAQRKNSGYQPVIGSSLAFLGTGSEISGPTLSSGQPRRSSISSCYPIRPRQTASATTLKIQPVVSSTNAVAPIESNHSPSRLMNSQMSSDMMLRRGSSPILSSPRRPSGNVVNDSIYPLLRSAFGKDTDVNREETTAKTTFNIKRPDKPSPAYEVTSHSSDSIVMKDPVTRNVSGMLIEPNVRVIKSPNPVDQESQFPSRIQYDQIMTKSVDQQKVESLEFIKSSKYSLASQCDEPHSNLNQCDEPYSYSNHIVKEPNSVSVDTDSKWYEPIPVTPRRRILSSQLSSSKSPAITPANTEASEPYAAFYNQLEGTSNRITQSTPDCKRTMPEESIPLEVSSSPPPLPSSKAPPSFGPLQHFLETSLIMETYPLHSSENDDSCTADISSWVSVNKSSDMPTTSLSIVHHATDSFNTEDSGLDRSDEGLIGVDGGFDGGLDVGLDSSADELDLKSERSSLVKDRLRSDTMFSSREDVTADAPTSRGYNPNAKVQKLVPSDPIYHGGSPRDIEGHLSPALSDADSGIGYVKHQPKLTEPVMDLTTSAGDDLMKGNQMQGIIFQLLAETNSSIDSLKSLFGPQANAPDESTSYTGETRSVKNESISSTTDQSLPLTDLHVIAPTQFTASKPITTSEISSDLPPTLLPVLPLEAPPPRLSALSQELQKPCSAQIDETESHRNDDNKLLPKESVISPSNLSKVGNNEEYCVQVQNVSNEHLTVSKKLENANDSRESNNVTEVVESGIMTVQIEKGNLGIGFCIEGGKGSAVGDRPILIKRLFKGNVTVQQALKAGDEVISVNGRDMSVLSQYDAWNSIKSMPDGIVTVVIRRQ